MKCRIPGGNGQVHSFNGKFLHYDYKLVKNRGCHSKTLKRANTPRLRVAEL